MTQRAIAGIPVDWQVQLAAGADATAVASAVTDVAQPSAMLPVGYARVGGFNAVSGGTMQTTGPGVVVGLPPDYARSFPTVLRLLTGAPSGVLLAQQTAANLHAHVGDTVSANRVGGPPVSARVGGIVDLPYADSFFQSVGLPPSAGPPAPPDNVLIVPVSMWHRWFDAGASAQASSVHQQLHVRVTRRLPHDPVDALTRVLTMARDVELRTAGTAAIGDNLAAQLQSTREDAYYSRLLFLFLALPGALLAILLALTVIGSGNGRRRREAALLRIRGATETRVRRLVFAEAVFVAGCGVAIGIVLTYAAVWWFVRRAGDTSASPYLWAGIACAAGAIIVIAAYLAGLGAPGAAAAERKVYGGESAAPLWRRLYLDWMLLAIGAAVFWRSAAAGYQVVLAPEGVLQASVSYDAFLAPLCLWLGGALAARRLSESLLTRRGKHLDKILAPFAGALSPAVAATLSRQRATIGAALTMLGLALSFAMSTAIFDATYNAQARVDAEMTNGADVSVSAPAPTNVDDIVREIGKLTGVASVASMQHRFAYVGQDLQDFFGIDPVAIGRATNISDAYFANTTAGAALAALSRRTDGVFVSQETVNDFQLQPGDTLRLRLQFARDGKYHPVPFVFLGVVREFPTAPKDSFLVANAAYISAATGTAGPPTILIRTAPGTDPAQVAGRVRSLVRDLPGARVSDIGQATRSVGSSLTAVDLRGLSTVELGFAAVLAAGVAFLTLALGFAERRRNHAILTALGASSRQLASFLWSEGAIMLAGGVIFGVMLGFAVAEALVKVLTGVFDPPPTGLTVPWTYVLVVFAVTVAATVLSIVMSVAAARRDPVRELRRA